MLRSQLIAAIGKIVTPEDFGNYMRFHYRKLYLNEYAPQLFCYAVRRPDHYPEGTLSIEEAGGSDTSDPIQTVVCARPAHKLMYLPINAATKVGFGGDRYLHAWVSHQFSGHSSTSLSLVARARQFSSFILVVGRIGGPSLFEPKHAIIIQNKDELKIPVKFFFFFFFFFVFNFHFIIKFLSHIFLCEFISCFWNKSQPQKNSVMPSSLSLLSNNDSPRHSEVCNWRALCLACVSFKSSRNWRNYLDFLMTH